MEYISVVLLTEQEISVFLKSEMKQIKVSLFVICQLRVLDLTEGGNVSKINTISSLPSVINIPSHG